MHALVLHDSTPSLGYRYGRTAFVREHRHEIEVPNLREAFVDDLSARLRNQSRVRAELVRAGLVPKARRRPRVTRL